MTLNTRNCAQSLSILIITLFEYHDLSESSISLPCPFSSPSSPPCILFFSARPTEATLPWRSLFVLLPPVLFCLTYDLQKGSGSRFDPIEMSHASRPQSSRHVSRVVGVDHWHLDPRCDRGKPKPRMGRQPKPETKRGSKKKLNKEKC